MGFENSTGETDETMGTSVGRCWTICKSQVFKQNGYSVDNQYRYNFGPTVLNFKRKSR